MLKGSVVSIFISLIFYGIGYSRMLLADTQLTESGNMYDFTINVFFATGSFVLASAFALSGLILYHIRYCKIREAVRKRKRRLKDSSLEDVNTGKSAVKCYTPHARRLTS